ncbi:hypothetical protein DFH09DRAFT_1323819 [Mycena vulgaris]|nr:hypothetical protein DFH09DRAFT_1323819 [Mycena vulgaris]
MPGSARCPTFKLRILRSRQRGYVVPSLHPLLNVSRERGVYCVHAPRQRARDPQRAAPLHIQSLDFALPRARVHFAPLPPSSPHHGATPSSATPRRAHHHAINAPPRSTFKFWISRSRKPSYGFPGAARRSRAIAVSSTRRLPDL